MATSDYKNALTNMRNFILGGGYVAGTLSGKNINPETGGKTTSNRRYNGSFSHSWRHTKHTRVYGAW